MRIEEFNQIVKDTQSQRDLEWKAFIEFSILRLLPKKKAEKVLEAMDKYK